MVFDSLQLSNISGFYPDWNPEKKTLIGAQELFSKKPNNWKRQLQKQGLQDCLKKRSFLLNKRRLLIPGWQIEFSTLNFCGCKLYSSTSIVLFPSIPGFFASKCWAYNLRGRLKCYLKVGSCLETCGLRVSKKIKS